MKKNHILSNIVILFCLLVFLFSAWKLWGYYKNYHGGKEEYKDLRKYVESHEEEKNKKGKDGKDICPVSVDFESLSTINSDVVGWIYIPDTDINYPVVQGEDNEYYLTHTFEKTENFSGAIFLDALCENDFSSDNSIIYGHNLKNGAMFGTLKRLYDKNYNEEADYKKHPVIWILTPDSVQEYQIFASREISAAQDGNVYMIDFATEEEYETYLQMAIKKSQYQTEMEYSSMEPMLTLSTCTSDSEDGRFIVQAIQIQ